MAQLIQAFNAQQYDPSQGVGGLPVGKHPVIVESSEVKANAKNDGGYLQLNLQIIDGPAKGTTGAYRLNLYHSNQQTVEIAHRQLSAVCYCVGVFMVQDSAQLHGIPFLVEVGLQKGEEAAQKGYTEVKRVFDINGNEPGKAGQGAAQPQPHAQQHQPAQGFGQQQQPQGQQAAAWGQQQPAAQPQQQPQGNGAAWGQPPAQQGPAQGGAPAWGQGQQQQPQGQQQPAAAGWQQGNAPANAPWGAR